MTSTSICTCRINPPYGGIVTGDVEADLAYPAWVERDTVGTRTATVNGHISFWVADKPQGDFVAATQSFVDWEDGPLTIIALFSLIAALVGPIEVSTMISKMGPAPVAGRRCLTRNAVRYATRRLPPAKVDPGSTGIIRRTSRNDGVPAGRRSVESP